VLTLLVLGGSVVPGCSSDDQETSSVLDEVAPTKSTWRPLPASSSPSTTDFRLVRISGDQIDVSFTIAATDVDEFASGSGIELTSGERTITHASPLWDVAVSGEVQGGSSTRNQIGRNAECWSRATPRRCACRSTRLISSSDTRKARWPDAQRREVAGLRRLEGAERERLTGNPRS
jgi:hypothetical protein